MLRLNSLQLFMLFVNKHGETGGKVRTVDLQA